MAYARAAQEWTQNPDVRQAVSQSLSEFMSEPSPPETPSPNPLSLSATFSYDHNTPSFPNPSVEDHSAFSYNTSASSSYTAVASGSSLTYSDSFDMSSPGPLEQVASQSSLTYSDAFPMLSPGPLEQRSPSPMVQSPSPNPDPFGFLSDTASFSPDSLPIPSNDQLGSSASSGSSSYQHPSTAIATTNPGPYQIRGFTTASGDFLPVASHLRSTVALDDNASIYSINPTSNGGGSASDLNALLKAAYVSSGINSALLEDIDFVGTRFIKENFPVIGGVGKWSRSLERGNSFRGVGWTRIRKSFPGSISSASQSAITIFSQLQVSYVPLYGYSRPMESCESLNTENCSTCT